jgi:seryl-tRNA synthetase
MTQNALRDLKSFLQENEELIEDIRDGAKSLAALNDKLDQHRQDADALLSQINNLSFAPARDEDVRKRQRVLLEKIEQLSKEISTHADDPELLILFFAQRGDLWFALGNTFNEAAGSIITFSTQEVDELRVLLRRATLDAAARQRAADVVDAAVQLSKFAFRIATKVVA